MTKKKQKKRDNRREKFMRFTRARQMFCVTTFDHWTETLAAISSELGA
jgi:hypothetical protein